MWWKERHDPARFGEALSTGVRCGLCPRSCHLAEGTLGFCGVRGNHKGQLVTLTYGKGVEPTEEVVETEAVYHWGPGSRTLSLGNIGCNLRCVYCQNWSTSQARKVRGEDVRPMDPHGIVETAKRHNIHVLSWTYNDPVVWIEFLLDTAAVAKREGLVNLFKSAFYITAEAVAALLPVIDIFSISVKSPRPEYYRKWTGGELAPVLAGARQVRQAGRHLEISNLMVTGLSDDEESARLVSDWVLRDLGDDVPLHFVRFHPSHEYAATVRTPIERLVRARQVALEMGVKHVYLGNVHDSSLTSTWCSRCGRMLVRRYGLSAVVEALDAAGRCSGCGLPSGIVRVEFDDTPAGIESQPAGQYLPHRHWWHEGRRSAHVYIHNLSNSPQTVLFCGRIAGDGRPAPRKRAIQLRAGERYRFAAAQDDAGARAMEVLAPLGVQVRVLDCLDRAHYPADQEIESQPSSRGPDAGASG